MPQHNRILDEYTCRTDLSRQEKYQLRAIRDQRCRQCHRKALPSLQLCMTCNKRQVERMRDRADRVSHAALIIANQKPQDLI